MVKIYIYLVSENSFIFPLSYYHIQKANFAHFLSDFLSSRTVWAETGDFRENGHTTMASVANSLDINQLHFQTTTNIRNTKNRDRKTDGMYTSSRLTPANPIADTQTTGLYLNNL